MTAPVTAFALERFLDGMDVIAQDMQEVFSSDECLALSRMEQFIHNKLYQSWKEPVLEIGSRDQRDKCDAYLIQGLYIQYIPPPSFMGIFAEAKWHTISVLVISNASGRVLVETQYIPASGKAAYTLASMNSSDNSAYRATIKNVCAAFCPLVVVLAW
ncbi:hypothetical protein M404DRAFT_35881 [Pisolithus tinctorius Marx 270]|uniref:Uncharacterized protein n=1 Tax=Pisolithus tinctorius Marx 270 TaxID=870435 RepID=A0A0C3MXQ0_PISTI|nr:hypothetical protein M404DRAFT_35881 [Pisolithus tinctorius Marx 270]